MILKPEQKVECKLRNVKGKVVGTLLMGKNETEFWHIQYEDGTSMHVNKDATDIEKFLKIIEEN